MKTPLLLAEPSLKAIERLCLAPGQILVALDYDDTLVALSAAEPDPALADTTRDALRRLATRAGVHVVVFSGRTHKELHKLVKLKEVALAPLHGFELFDGGERETHDDDARAQRIIEATIEEMGGKIEGYETTKIENRRVTLVVEHPSLTRKESEALATHLAGLLSGERVQVVEGRRTIEVLPDIAWDRSLAMRRFMERHRKLGSFPLLVCAGDDAFDAPLLRMARDMSGIAIGVGREAARHGNYVAESPGDVVRFLESLDGWLAARAPVGG